ncbi:shikimate kinase [Legionella geestiana]|uniref:Shikimate kinase n=1 Tax=Legionella geestiana TaxID=45065 RepID=A0A0W0U7E9_9GAMM|nr:shikimate kinase [Legionella geestiana]KTD03706.1 shikimate kinase [Legionella geestiana]STX53808.1 shikimate kinase [Legionella geestiana]
MTMPKRIFIVGHMGAGKFLLAEALAQKLGWHLIDANPSLERYIGRSLEHILGKQGEEAFHRCEAEIIAHCIQKEHAVIVLEESVIATEENRKLLSSQCVVYVAVSTSTQMERMKPGRVPLLPIPNLKEFLDKQHLERDHWFEAVASLTVESVSLEKDLEFIMEQLNGENDNR